MQHASGAHGSLDYRTAIPIPFLAYYPAVIPQSSLSERFVLLNGPAPRSIQAGHPPRYAPLTPRKSYNPSTSLTLASFGPTTLAPLGSIVEARSGDKGANINVGFFVGTVRRFAWLKTFLTIERMKELMGDDWDEKYSVERVEFKKIRAVHFVIYGPLGRGVSSSKRLDGLGKGFADFIRDRWVDVPDLFFEETDWAKI